MAVRKVLDMLRVTTALGEVQTARFYLLKAITGIERDSTGGEGTTARLEKVIAELDGIAKDLLEEGCATVGIDMEKALKDADPKARR